MRSLVVLAGGLGTRLRDVVSEVPKPMAPVAGRPFLAWVLDGWIDRSWGFERVVISVGYRAEVIRQFFGDQYRGVSVRYVEEDRPLGTGGALMNLCRDIRGEACVINGDTWFMPDRNFSWPVSQPSPAITMLLKLIDDAGRYSSVSLSEECRIVGLKKGRTGEAYVNGGVCFFNSEAVGLAASGHIPVGTISLEDDLFQDWMASGRCDFYGHANDAPFIDIGVPETYLRAEKFLRDQR